MLQELDKIDNPTLKERLDKGTVKNFINNVGLGLKNLLVSLYNGPTDWCKNLTNL